MHAVWVRRWAYEKKHSFYNVRGASGYLRNADNSAYIQDEHDKVSLEDVNTAKRTECMTHPEQSRAVDFRSERIISRIDSHVIRYWYYSIEYSIGDNPLKVVPTQLQSTHAWYNAHRT